MREILLYLVVAPLVLAILKNPFVGVVVYTGINIIRPEMLFWGGAQGSVLHKVVFISLLLSCFFNQGTGLVRFLPFREVLLLFWMYLAVLVSIVMTGYPLHQRAYYYSTELLKLAVFALLLAAVMNSASRILIYERFYLALFSILALWGAEQHFRGNVRLEDIGDFDSNGLAALLVLALPIGMNLAVSGASKVERSFGVVSAIVLSLGVVFTQSRGGFLGMMVCLAVLFVRSRHKKKFLACVAVAVAVAVPFLTESYLSRISTISAEQQERDYSAASRVLLWKAGLLLFKDNPVFGAGLLSFPVAVGQYRDSFDDEEQGLLNYTFNGTKVAHSTYVQMLSEGGLFLFVPYLWLLAGTFRANRRIRATAKVEENSRLEGMLDGIEAGIWGFCFSTIFINSLGMVFLPMQIVVSRMIRERLAAERAQDAVGAGNAACGGVAS